MIELKREMGLRRALLIDWGKNMLAYRLACESAGVQIVAIADPKLAGRKYRDARIVTDEEASAMEFDAAIISNMSPVHAAERLSIWQSRTDRVVVDLFAEDRANQCARNAA
jgi:hypothetical protein